MTDSLGDSGLKVSKIILGCMTFGSSKWQGSPWILDEEEGLKILKKAYDVGINTWVRMNCIYPERLAMVTILYTGHGRHVLQWPV